MSSLNFVGIHGVLSEKSKSNICDPTNLFAGNNEEKGVQQL
jgi:hypothetical protein